MTTLFQVATQVLSEAWDVLLDSAPYIILGFVVAGLLKAYLPNNLVGKHLGKGKFRSVIKSALFGIPLPLCSCGVLPAAAGLKQQGAGKGAVSSFMIATPETGVDSIAITYALLDPIMTIFRPISAFITAVTTGFFVNLTDNDATSAVIESEKEPDSSCCSGSSCCGSGTTRKDSWWDKFKNGMRFSFGDLIDDIGGWLIIGVLLAGLISVFISPHMIEVYLGNGLLSMVFMLVLATPLYVCATASTPIAAALVLKGLSPGAALVFLLAGPATNIATITVVSRVIGKKATFIYLASILICSLAMGLLVNQVYHFLGLNILSWTASNTAETHGLISYASTIILVIFILRGFSRKLKVQIPWLANKTASQTHT